MSPKVVVTLLGVVLAAFVLGGIVGFAATSVADGLGLSGRATTSATCDGADVDLTVGTLPESDSVFGQVIVTDDEKRHWEVTWPTGVHLDPELPGTSLGGFVRQGFQVLGDTDDGSSREVALRPRGASEWCRVTADFS